MSIRKIRIEDFDIISKRLKSELGLANDKELYQLIETSQGTFSRRKIENNFSVEWAYLISNKTGLNINWILKGEGSKKDLDEASVALLEDPIITDIKSWLKDLRSKEPKISYWFEIEFKRKFPEFNEWLEKKGEAVSSECDYEQYKISNQKK